MIKMAMSSLAGNFLLKQNVIHIVGENNRLYRETVYGQVNS